MTQVSNKTRVQFRTDSCSYLQGKDTYFSRKFTLGVYKSGYL